MTDAVALRIDAARLWERHMRLARHGALPSGGVNRQALSVEEAAAWRELIGWARECGLEPSTDAAGNLFLRLEGTDTQAAPVLTGSHLDSQPTGGKFDGVYGVLAGLEAAQAIVEAGIRLQRPLEIVAWMNEEGSRFAPGMMGSAAFAGATPLERFLPVRDHAGTSVEEGLAGMRNAFPELALRALGRTVAAYLEAHIEQGPLLERAGRTIGVVTGIQGKRTFRVTVHGEEAHAGTSTRRERKDALLAAIGMIGALTEVMHDADDLVKFTVGRFDVLPNAPSVVPAVVVFSIDLRHVDSSALMALGERIEPLCRKHAGPCSVEVAELTRALSLDFPASMTRLVRDTAHRLGIASMDIYSAAGHDARFMHGICPTGMIFVPCKDGISHNPQESATPQDLAAGARVLAAAVVELASG
ncbi:MAG: hydantoinase/carbamoylase family amidase [Casimicrobiaceae bacterium]